jgi:hypothetical protein
MRHCLCLSDTSLTFLAALTDLLNWLDRDLDSDWGNRAG